MLEVCNYGLNSFLDIWVFVEEGECSIWSESRIELYYLNVIFKVLMIFLIKGFNNSIESTHIMHINNTTWKPLI